MQLKIAGAICLASAALAGCQSLATQSLVSLENLNKIEIGASKEQVRQALGAPDGISFFKRLNEALWTYEHPVLSQGTILISFKDGDRVTSINVVPFVQNFPLAD